MTTQTRDLAPLQPATTTLAAHAARVAPHVARFTLGAAFFVFGLNGFLNFIPPPSAPVPEGAMAFAGALAQTGYMFPLIKGTEVVAGALLLANRFVPLALTLLAPVIVNIIAFHAFLTGGDVALPLIIAAVTLYLAWTRRTAFAPMLKA